MKKKFLHTVLAGAIVVGGSGFAGVSALANELPSNSETPILISAPAEEAPVQESKTKYSDIADHWAYEQIVELEEKGVWADEADVFQPNQPVEKDLFVHYLHKIFEFETDNTPNLDFITGDQVTRMETARAIEASFVAKELSLIMTLVFPVYDDTTDLSKEETSALSFVFNTNIMKGRSSENFYPGEALTRAELATVLSRTMAAIDIAEQNDALNEDEAGAEEGSEDAEGNEASDIDKEAADEEPIE